MKFTAANIRSMKEALDYASSYFERDPIHSSKIATASALLQEGIKEAMPKIRDYVCNLHMIVIAETGFDLNKTAYCNTMPQLPARYVAFPRTDKGAQILEEIRRKHPDAVKEFLR